VDHHEVKRLLELGVGFREFTVVVDAGAYAEAAD
jgi:hypothetical protein